jgi:hypothetical protein
VYRGALQKKIGGKERSRGWEGDLKVGRSHYTNYLERGMQRGWYIDEPKV